MISFNRDSIEVEIYNSREQMGVAAAEAISAYVRQLHTRKKEINIVFAAAPSQNEFLNALQKCDLPWDSINAFHMDEYIGLEEDARQGFGNFLRSRIFDMVPFRSVHYLFAKGVPAEKICTNYAALLRAYPTDIVLMGIGENGHIAFNDPHVARFDDSEQVKIVSLDRVCRQQQVNDGCFASIEQVPTHAITLTVPALLSAEKIICVVPGPMKADAIAATVNGPITNHCPATALRTHRNNVTLYCDLDSAKHIIQP
ncbi:glucosamine-6-phosphate deaminase [Bacteroidia bacterium]|nr:glucosamine-6-phosphate deaminase [Bacteroidia bacterium]